MTRSTRKMPTVTEDSKDMIVAYTLWQENQHGEGMLAGLLPSSEGPDVCWLKQVEELVLA